MRLGLPFADSVPVTPNIGERPRQQEAPEKVEVDPLSHSVPVLTGEPAVQVRDLEKTPTERRRLYLGLHLKIFPVIASLPGYLNANLIASLLIDRPPPLRFDVAFPAVTVVIACFNEEDTVEETLDYIGRQDYPGDVTVLVADDGSTDRTLEAAGRRAATDARITVLPLPHAGKAPTRSSSTSPSPTSTSSTRSPSRSGSSSRSSAISRSSAR